MIPIKFKGDETVIPLGDDYATIDTHIYVDSPNEHMLIDKREISVYSPDDEATLGQIYRMVSAAYPGQTIYVQVDFYLNGYIYRGEPDGWIEYAKTKGMA